MAKSRNIIAIGGGGFGANPGQGIIEEYILKQTKKKNPKICFIPTATGDNEAYKVNFYSTFTNLNCCPSHLDFFKRTPDLNDLKKAYLNGVVMSGVSAGAICWFQNGITDSWASSLKIMPCLNFIKGTCCPHYDEEPERRPAVKKLLQNNKTKDVFAVDGGAALHIKDEKIFKSVVFRNEKSSYLVSYDGKKINEKSFKKIKLI